MARLEEIFEEKTKLAWTEKLEKIAKKREETRELRSKEIEQMRGIVEAKKRLLAERAKNPRRSGMRPLRTKNEKASRGFGEALEGPGA